MLVLEADAGDKADKQPLPIVSAGEDSHDEEHECHPDEKIERRRREKMPDRHRNPRGGSRERRHRLSRTTGAELSGDQGDQHHDEGDRDRGQHPQSAGILAEHPLR